MFSTFFPDEQVDSTYLIDFEGLFQEGYRGVIFDIDNTLVEHDADANEKAIAFFKRLRKIGFRSCLLSNNDEERVKRFNQPIQTEYIFKAGKPSNRGYIQAMKKMHTKTENTLFVGDQLFTDVWGAKRMGIRNILVKPISPKEEIQIVLKRRLEKIVLRSWEKAKKKTNEKQDR